MHAIATRNKKSLSDRFIPSRPLKSSVPSLRQTNLTVRLGGTGALCGGSHIKSIRPPHRANSSRNQSATMPPVNLEPARLEKEIGV